MLTPTERPTPARMVKAATSPKLEAAFEAHLEEGKAVMAEDLDETTMDACLIAAAQRVEHYEMAAYGTLVAWARSMAHPGGG